MPIVLWILLGGVCLAVEIMVVPMFIVVYFGLAAWVVALALSLGLIDGVPAQWVLFAISAVILLLTTRAYCRRWLIGDSAAGSTGDANDDVGANSFAEVLETFEQGIGVVEWRGARWKAILSTTQNSEEIAMAEGDTVKVLSQDNLTLTVTEKF